MKEIVRVFVRGDWESLRAKWPEEFPWPFERGFATLQGNSPELAVLRQIAAGNPQFSIKEHVERTYTKRELLQFQGYVLWLNDSFESSKGEGLQYQAACAQCGHPARRIRTHPLEIRKSQAPRKDLASNDDWEKVMSTRLASAWQATGLTGLSFQPVLVDGSPGHYSVITVENDVSDPLPETLRYDGERCPMCGRYEKSYPIHASEELWVPRHKWPSTDISTLNAGLERTYNNRLLISNLAYRFLLDLKATGFWVQPVHIV